MIVGIIESILESESSDHEEYVPTLYDLRYDLLWMIFRDSKYRKSVEKLCKDVGTKYSNATIKYDPESSYALKVTLRSNEDEDSKSGMDLLAVKVSDNGSELTSISYETTNTFSKSVSEVIENIQRIFDKYLVIESSKKKSKEESDEESRSSVTKYHMDKYLEIISRDEALTRFLDSINESGSGKSIFSVLTHDPELFLVIEYCDNRVSGPLLQARFELNSDGSLGELDLDQGHDPVREWGMLNYVSSSLNKAFDRYKVEIAKEELCESYEPYIDYRYITTVQFSDYLSKINPHLTVKVDKKDIKILGTSTGVRTELFTISSLRERSYSVLPGGNQDVKLRDDIVDIIREYADTPIIHRDPHFYLKVPGTSVDDDSYLGISRLNGMIKLVNKTPNESYINVFSESDIENLQHPEFISTLTRIPVELSRRSK